MLCILFLHRSALTPANYFWISLTDVAFLNIGLSEDNFGLFQALLLRFSMNFLKTNISQNASDSK